MKYMKVVGKLSIFLFLAILTATSAFADQNVTQCGQLYDSDTYYLQNDLSVNGGNTSAESGLDACFGFEADNVIFDCQGYTIDVEAMGAPTDTAFGAGNGDFVTTFYNFTLRNCNLVNGWIVNDAVWQGAFVFENINYSAGTALLDNDIFNLNNVLSPEGYSVEISNVVIDNPNEDALTCLATAFDYTSHVDVDGFVCNGDHTYQAISVSLNGLIGSSSPSNSKSLQVQSQFLNFTNSELNETYFTASGGSGDLEYVLVENVTLYSPDSTGIFEVVGGNGVEFIFRNIEYTMLDTGFYVRQVADAIFENVRVNLTDNNEAYWAYSLEDIGMTYFYNSTSALDYRYNETQNVNDVIFGVFNSPLDPTSSLNTGWFPINLTVDIGAIQDETNVTELNLLGYFDPNGGGLQGDGTPNATFEYFADSLGEAPIEVTPVASFTANQTTGYAPLTVSFTDTSTNTPTSWAWDFNRDGIVDNTTQNPVYTFTVPGTYEVNLTVTNGAGSSTTVKSIVANSTLFSKSFTTSGIQPMWITGIVVTPSVDVIVSGFNRTTQTSGAVNWAIYDNATKTVLKSGDLNNEFGAGESNSVPFNQTLIAGQSYIFAFVSNPGVNIHEYGRVGGQTYPQTYGVFTVNAGFNSTVNTSSFVPNDPQGYSDNVWFTVNSIRYIEAPELINVTTPTIVANFTANQTSGFNPFTVSFTDTTVSQGAITSWAWDFNNDGIVDNTTQNPEYTYTSAGTFSVRLNASNAYANDTELKTSYIVVGNGVPVANFTANAVSGNVPFTVTFTDNSTNVPTSWQWDLDGNNITDNTSQNPQYTYNTPGNYTVRLIAINAAGNDSETKIDYIQVLDSLPVADFSADDTVVYVGESVQFTSSSTGNITSYAWDFENDGVVDSNETNPSHVYGVDGTYTVNLTVAGPGGSDELVRTNYITVYPLPTITSFCGPIVYPNELDAPSVARFQFNFTADANSPASSGTEESVQGNRTGISLTSSDNRYAPPFPAPNPGAGLWNTIRLENLTLPATTSASDTITVWGNATGFRTGTNAATRIVLGVMNGNNGTLYYETNFSSLQNVANATNFSFTMPAQAINFTGPLMLQFRSNINFAGVRITSYVFNVTVTHAPVDVEATSSYNLSLARSGDAPRSVDCTSTYLGSDITNYNCTAPMNFYNRAGDYGLSINYSVNGQNISHVNSTLCEYGELVAFQRTGSVLTFDNATTGSINVLAPENITLRNTGNTDLNISINARNLKGRNLPLVVLGAANFKMGINLGLSQSLVHNNNVFILTLEPGQDSYSVLRTWLSVPTNQLLQDYYTENAWQVVGE